MKNYVKEIREKVGKMPLIMCGAAIIVENNKEEILLQKRNDNGLWGYAGGYIEYGEPLEVAAKRELYEETGLIAKKISFFANFSGKEMIYTYPNGDEVYVIEHIFICRDYEGKLLPQEEEVSELKFFDWKNLPHWEEITPLNRMGLKAYLENKKKDKE